MYLCQVTILPRNAKRRSLVSVFSGIGGLDAGLERSGFEVVYSIENSDSAKSALRRLFPHWPQSRKGDIHDVSGTDLLTETGLRNGDVALLAAGPPCQPFSKASAWARPASRSRDPRASTIPALFRLAAQISPEVVLIENVRELITHGGEGVMRRAFTRLNSQTGGNYNPTIFDIECSAFGVPQKRRRVFIIAHREGLILTPPSPTHGDALGLRRWASTWDAIGHMDNEIWPKQLQPSGYWADLLASIPEGANYAHHTSRGSGVPLFGWRTKYWSFLLKLAKGRPSWTLSATPGPATGPFHWRSRRLSFYELAALQTFPASCDPGLSLRESQRLLGNAVPSAIGELLGRLIVRQILGGVADDGPLSLLPAFRDDCPEPENPRAVVPKYHRHIGTHADHPGEGKGPGVARRRRNALRPARSRAA